MNCNTTKKASNGTVTQKKHQNKRRKGVIREQRISKWAKNYVLQPNYFFNLRFLVMQLKSQVRLICPKGISLMSQCSRTLISVLNYCLARKLDTST